MSSPHAQPTSSTLWKKLQQLAVSKKQESISDYFLDDANRLDRFSIKLPGLYVDLSKNRVSNEILDALLKLVEGSALAGRIAAMFEGEIINTTENRAVLHTALRNPASEVVIDNKRIATLVDEQLRKMQQFSDTINSGDWKGNTGKSITDIVNIGIGGSDLGPRMVCEALSEFSNPQLTSHFISNVDGAEINSLLAKLNAETTLFIVCSKTFITQETMLNAQTALAWLKQRLSIKFPQSSEHFIAVTSNRENALAFGIESKNIFTFWDWVGGRYSLWSSIGLSICTTIGFENFQQFLQGAKTMDDHFQTAKPEKNMPIMLALMGIWYNNFLGAQSAAIIPYCQRLAQLPAYLQQLDMESNGKSANIHDLTAEHSTGPIIWGQTGTNGQHAFFQLLHQGSKLVPVDFIATVIERMGDQFQHKVLLTNMIAQSCSLMSGEPNDDIHKRYPGNKPSNTLLLDELSPHSLGMLIALYEHKVFVQGVIWEINSFDQWGVELGKRLTRSLLKNDSDENLDPSTLELLRRIQKDDSS